MCVQVRALKGRQHVARDPCFERIVANCEDKFDASPDLVHVRICFVSSVQVLMPSEPRPAEDKNDDRTSADNKQNVIRSRSQGSEPDSRLRRRSKARWTSAKHGPQIKHASSSR